MCNDPEDRKHREREHQFAANVRQPKRAEYGVKHLRNLAQRKRIHVQLNHHLPVRRVQIRFEHEPMQVP
jgi:hypothetical protein